MRAGRRGADTNNGSARSSSKLQAQRRRLIREEPSLQHSSAAGQHAALLTIDTACHALGGVTCAIDRLVAAVF